MPIIFNTVIRKNCQIEIKFFHGIEIENKINLRQRINILFFLVICVNQDARE